MKERNKGFIKVVGAGVILMAIVAVCLVIKISDYRDRQIILDYQETFMELEFIPEFLTEAEVGRAVNEITDDQYKELIQSYGNLSNVYSYKEIPKEEIKAFNNSIRQIFGTNSPYIINTKYERDYYGFADGLAYWQLEYAIILGRASQSISDEDFNEYKRKKQEFFESFSEEKVYDMYGYMAEILIKTLSDL